MLLFRHMRKIYGKTQKRNSLKRGSGWIVLGKVFQANTAMFTARKFARLHLLYSPMSDLCQRHRNQRVCALPLALGSDPSIYLLLSSEIILAVITSALYYSPAFFLQKFISFLEEDPGRTQPAWGWIYCLALFLVTAITYILTGMLW
jgi:hypothetical protein